MVKRALENKDPVKSVLQDDAPQELRDGNEEASRREDRWRALLSVVPPLDSQGSEEGLQKLPPCRALLETSKPDEIVSGSRDRNLEDEQHPRKKLAADGEAAASIANSSSRSRNSVGIDSRTESDNQDVDDTARELSNGNSAGHGNASSSKQKRASYACNLCGSSFAEKYNLNKHVRTVHEKKRPFSCDICPVSPIRPLPRPFLAPSSRRAGKPPPNSRLARPN